MIYRQPANDLPANGTREHPAIITRVWGMPNEETPTVNLHVCFDASSGESRTSVPHSSVVKKEERESWDWPPRA